MRIELHRILLVGGAALGPWGCQSGTESCTFAGSCVPSNGSDPAHTTPGGSGATAVTSEGAAGTFMSSEPAAAGASAVNAPSAAPSPADADASNSPRDPADDDPVAEAPLRRAPDLPACEPVADASVQIDFAPETIVRDVSHKPWGININYLWDDDENRPAGARPLLEALKELGVGRLRYPGGEKSDSYFWSMPPYDSPKPTVVRTTNGPQKDPDIVDQQTREFRIEPLDFDEFMDLAQAVEAEPVIVTPYDNLSSYAAAGIDLDDLKQNAVQWVRYANVTNDYGIRYWEIGNEAWNHGAADPATYARHVTEFSRAMKAVDPTIQIGMTGVHWQADWWPSTLPIAGADIDILAAPNYPGHEWRGYQHYVDNHDLNLTSHMDGSVELMRHAPAADRDRLGMGATEVNSHDFSSGEWTLDNNLGHALVTFDTMMRLSAHSHVEYANIWNTRWWPEGGTDAPDIWTALDEQNQLTPSGRVLQIMGQFVLDNIVEASSSDPRVVVFASSDGQAASVFLINKGYDEQTVSVATQAPDAQIWRFSGNGESDVEPNWGPLCNATTESEAIRLRLEPVSLTVLYTGK